MDQTTGMIEELLANKQAFVLLLTAGFGLLTGKLLRAAVKIVAYFIGIVALFLVALQYLGLIYIAVNYDFLHEIFQWVVMQARGIGLSEHLFFWLPMVYGIRKKGLYRFP